ncbi:transcriptional regulatory protein AraC family [Calothrix parasitica NIES-267]|uniref:Transcriptional regulatory protein AraC family n=1 Tax=Calothrix parasitica NIES-267 TaxID=1973488 RepID=A0A1Z4LKA7_9CYAN|nr:transcriptional regulatory protein AraC family [Calothrix parasitica NIES-267]
MKVSFSISDLNELFAEVSQQTDSAIITHEHEQAIKFPSLICNGWMRKFQLRPGLELIVQDLKFQDNFILEAEYNELNIAFGISFCLNGSTQGKVYGTEEEYNLASGQGNLGFALKHKGTMEYQVGQQVTVVSLIMEPRMFDSFIDSQITHIPNQLQQIINGKNSCFYVQHFKMTSAMKIAAQQIINCPYQGLTEKLYLEAKGIEILAYYTEKLLDLPNDSQQIINLKSDDINRIYYAKEILFKNFQNPPSLINLAKLVGLNDYKLKVGFRYCFGNTVFGCLHDYRMEEAKKLLKTKKLNINQVARCIGYASVTSFSSAFRKKFGVSPSVYRAST